MLTPCFPLTFIHRWNRNWRFHKDMRLWLTKEAGTRPSGKIEGGEAGAYTYWDPENWEKQRKELTVMYSDLEEKATPVFAGPTVQPSAQQAPSQQQQIQAQVAQMQQAAQTGVRGSFPGIGMAAGI